ncbi:MAG TPA: FAD-dependent oxidoreductase [Bryobacteraceae bacterium]|nr:FAD-dependent oxidoreductase [Bryobacteraceae bacterium]
MRIAVIGSGISGLAAAYYLSRKHEVSLFEKDCRLGGHTNTVTVDSSRGPIAVDTGFIVHNDRTYPNLVRLLSELGVETQPSDMSFAVSCPRTGFEYSSRGLNGFFAQRSNVFRPSQYRLLSEILRFNRTAPQLLNQPGAETATLGDFLDEGKYQTEFTERYLFPMACAVWSMSFDTIRSFPALTLIRFFDNHGMLGINTHPKWKVIRGGSWKYIPPLTAPYRERIHSDVEIASIARNDSGATLKFRSRPSGAPAPMAFDHVVFACHGDQILPLLESPTDQEREVLGNFATSLNATCLHTDSRLLPRRGRSRASWNYNLGRDAQDAVTVTYHMNRLQSLETEEDYCVTLNADGEIDPSKIILQMFYEHPLYTRRALCSQERWSEISGKNRTHFCGAYWFYGFHEDGLNSALRVARALGVEC